MTGYAGRTPESSRKSKQLESTRLPVEKQNIGAKSPVQVKIFVSVYIDRDSDRDSVRDRDKNNREKNYIDRVRDAK